MRRDYLYSFRNLYLGQFRTAGKYISIFIAVRSVSTMDANKRYKVEEINLMPGNHSTLECHGKTYSGDYLMKVGIPLLSSSHLQSHVVELTAE